MSDMQRAIGPLVTRRVHLRDEDARFPVATVGVVERDGVTELVWLNPDTDSPSAQYLPAVLFETHDGNATETNADGVRSGHMAARAHDAFHDEPLVSLYYDAHGRCVKMLVRRAPDIALAFEDIDAVPSVDA